MLQVKSTQKIKNIFSSPYSQATVKEPKLKANDKVHLSMSTMQFRKCYPPRYSDKIKGNFPNYKIKDLNKDILTGAFYQEELQNVYEDNDVLYMESTIIKKVGTRKVLSMQSNGLATHPLSIPG